MVADIICKAVVETYARGTNDNIIPILQLSVILYGLRMWVLLLGENKSHKILTLIFIPLCFAFVRCMIADQFTEFEMMMMKHCVTA